HDVWYGISAYYNAVEVWQDFSYTINDESPGSVSISIIPTNGGNVEPGATFNSFQFHKYDPWGADGVQLGFDIVMTDANGAVNTDHVALEFDLGAIGHPINYFTQSHDHPAGTYTSPVVLALGADSPSYLNTQLSKVSYDINIDGVADTVAWAAPGSGVLGIDLNGDHQISDTSEFAFKQYVEGAQTDLEGLKAFDTNRNVMLDTGDTQWSQFGVWEDKNADGTTQDGEYQSLDALGISSIDLKSDGQMHNAGTPLEPGGEASADVVVFGTASYTRTDGSTGAAQDAMFAYQDGAQALPAPELLSTSDAQEAELNRQVLQFNQMCNTAVDATSEPLGFVPIAPDLYATASFPDMFQAMNDPVLTVDNTNTQLLAA
ncbi:MAG: hypothetical protein ABI606_10095, partial [Rhodoferax sp.]